jgi:hypothetical protein
MRLAGYSLGQVISVGIMATIFILGLKFVGGKYPQLPVIGPVSRAV